MRLRYRDDLREVVSQIIRMRIDPASATAYIQRRTEASVPPEMRERFRQAVESDLIALNQGNVARFPGRLSEFEAWRQVWNGKTDSGVE